MLPIQMLPFEKIICPLDFSETSEEALRCAAELAFESDAKLLLLHVVRFSPSKVSRFNSEEEVQRDASAKAQEQLGQLASTDLSHVKKVEILVKCGSSAGTVIADTARKESVGLIVIGTHGETGVRRLVLGSVAAEVVRAAPCPVLTVRTSRKSLARNGRSNKILCAVDFSASSIAGLERAGELAAFWKAQLYALHVMVPPPTLGGITIEAYNDGAGSEAAQALLPILEKHLPEKVRERERMNRLVRTGKPAEEISNAAKEQAVDLIVMATHGQTGWRRWVFGSVTEAVIRTAPCPVLSVHPPQAFPHTAKSVSVTSARTRESHSGEKDPGLSLSNPWQVKAGMYPTNGSAADQLHFLLNYAILAPSNRNTQPWRWRVCEDTVELYADRTRTLPHLDPDDRQLVISCGAALLHLRLAIRHFGHQDVVDILPDDNDPDLLAVVRLEQPLPPSETNALSGENLHAHSLASDNTLFEAIVHRHTNRQPFRDIELPLTLKTALQKEATREGVDLVLLESSADKLALINLIETSDRAQGQDSEFVEETRGWIRSSSTLFNDGIPQQAYGGGGLISHYAANLGEAQADKDELLAWSAPSLVVLQTKDDTPRAWLAAGQALARVLLRCSSDGVQASFLNSPIEVVEAWPRLHHVIDVAGMPQVILRLGYPTFESEPIPRRPVSNVVFA